MARGTRTVVDGVYEVGQHQFVSWGFNLQSRTDVAISLNVREGPPVDASLTNKQGFHDYQQGRSYREIPELSYRQIKEATGEASVPPENYQYFISNDVEQGMLSSIVKQSTAVVDVQIVIRE